MWAAPLDWLSVVLVGVVLPLCKITSARQRYSCRVQIAEKEEKSASSRPWTRRNARCIDVTSTKEANVHFWSSILSSSSDSKRRWFRERVAVRAYEKRVKRIWRASRIARRDQRTDRACSPEWGTWHENPMNLRIWNREREKRTKKKSEHRRKTDYAMRGWWYEEKFVRRRIDVFRETARRVANVRKTDACVFVSNRIHFSLLYFLS